MSSMQLSLCFRIRTTKPHAVPRQVRHHLVSVQRRRRTRRTSASKQATASTATIAFGMRRGMSVSAKSLISAVGLPPQGRNLPTSSIVMSCNQRWRRCFHGWLLASIIFAVTSTNHDNSCFDEQRARRPIGSLVLRMYVGFLTYLFSLWAIAIFGLAVCLYMIRQNEKAEGAVQIWWQVLSTESTAL